MAADPWTFLRDAPEEDGACIVKLPCISATTQILDKVIDELRGADRLRAGGIGGDEAARVLGSVVNRHLRRGTSVRLLPDGPSGAAQDWPPLADTVAVATMSHGDFHASEKTHVGTAPAQALRIEFQSDGGSPRQLGPDFSIEPGDIVSCGFLCRDALAGFLATELDQARRTGSNFALQLKSTVFRQADEYIFGKAVEACLPGVFSHHGEELGRAGCDVTQGIDAVREAVGRLADPDTVEARLEQDLREGAPLWRHGHAVSSHLHDRTAPSIARSVADILLSGGVVPSSSGKDAAVRIVIPDSTHAAFYASAVEDLRQFGMPASTMVRNLSIVGMSKDAAEEYGAEATTFRIPEAGTVALRNTSGEILSAHRMPSGGVWRLIRADADAVDDWLSTCRDVAAETGWPVVFWLDPDRPHHQALHRRLATRRTLPDWGGLDIRVMGVAEATRFTLRRLRNGDSVVAAVGNLLRDYVSEFFFAMAGPSRQMVRSYCSLPRSGRMFEAGTGGTAPRVYAEFLATNILRWSSVGETLALAAAFRFLGARKGASRLVAIGQALEQATSTVVATRPDQGKRDARTEHFELALAWAEILASRGVHPAADHVLGTLRRSEATIRCEIAQGQGRPIDIGGYYAPDLDRLTAVMRPSPTLNAILDAAARG
jgi:isocitrate dehydrogenase